MVTASSNFEITASCSRCASSGRNHVEFRVVGKVKPFNHLRQQHPAPQHFDFGIQLRPVAGKPPFSIREVDDLLLLRQEPKHRPRTVKRRGEDIGLKSADQQRLRTPAATSHFPRQMILNSPSDSSQPAPSGTAGTETR